MARLEIGGCNSLPITCVVMFELFESCDLFFLGTGGVGSVARASPRELLLLILCLKVVNCYC